MLSDSGILKAIEQKKLLIYPFNQDRLGTNSYDVSLGEHFYTETPTTDNMYNIWSPEAVKEVWTPKYPINKIELIKKYPHNKFENIIRDDDQILILKPGECILGHTVEFIGGIKGITSKMYCRSSYGRSNISVCLCAGLGDIGYYNRWTMEIKNLGKYNSVPLVVNQPIGQICFDELKDEEINNYNKIGNYQKEDFMENGEININKLVKSWNPEMMLPRLKLK